MCSSPLKGHSRCCDVILTKPSFNCLPFEFAANLFWNELHTLKKHKKSFCWKKRGTENKEGKVGPKFSLNLPQHPYSGLLKEVFFLPSFLTSSIFLLSPSLSLEPSLNAVCIVFCWTHVLNRFVREAFGLPKGVLKRGGRYQHSLHLFTALWWHWLPEPQYAFYIFFFYTHLSSFSRSEPSRSCSSTDFPTWLQATPGCKWRFMTHMISWNSTLFYW